MGLDSFKTEGPRTFTDEDESTQDNPCIHVPKNTAVPDNLVPSNVEVHEVVMREEAGVVKLEGEANVFICRRCGSVSSKAVHKPKIDYIGNEDFDWADDAFEFALEQFKSMSTSEWEDICDVHYSNQMNKEQAEEQKENEEDDTPDSGLESFLS